MKSWQYYLVKIKYRYDRGYTFMDYGRTLIAFPFYLGGINQFFNLGWDPMALLKILVVSVPIGALLMGHFDLRYFKIFQEEQDQVLREYNPFQKEVLKRIKKIEKEVSR